MKRRSILSVAAVMAAAYPWLARAQAYPDHAIKILQGFAPGGNADNIARAISAEMSKVPLTFQH